MHHGPALRLAKRVLEARQFLHERDPTDFGASMALSGAQMTVAYVAAWAEKDSLFDRAIADSRAILKRLLAEGKNKDMVTSELGQLDRRYAHLLKFRGRLTDAITIYERLYAEARQRDDRWLRAEYAKGIGYCLAQLKRGDAALEPLDEAARLYEELRKQDPQRAREAEVGLQSVWMSLGDAHRLAKRREIALGFYERSAVSKAQHVLRGATDEATLTSLSTALTDARTVGGPTPATLEITARALQACGRRVAAVQAIEMALRKLDSADEGKAAENRDLRKKLETRLELLRGFRKQRM